MPSNNKFRSPNLDIIRIFALFTVVGIHFFINTYFLEQPIDNAQMYILTIFRNFFAVCVPLFIILTGYLMKNKTLSKKFYLGIVKTLGIYIIASVACHIFSVAYLGKRISVLSLATGILGFTAAPYAWYVEMYIGLFLLIPFLNLIYNNLGSKKHKLVLIATLIALTAAPSVLNVWNFASPASFINPSANTHYIRLIPSWWEEFYPITYYFIGCWLKEYGLGITKRKNAVLLLCSVLFWGVFNIYRSYPLPLAAGSWVTWGALPQVMNATLTFNLLLNIDEKAVPKKLHRPLKVLSDLTFGGYLMSWVSDQFFYAKLGAAASAPTKLIWLPIMVSLSFVSALVLSFIINLVYNFIYKAINRYILKRA
ncbi:MAG: hypothetical protein E7483_06620 [Ruminococcaceae bacterium]|nr:hypothetical protein [Oscillospiraceae bacterium]